MIVLDTHTWLWMVSAPEKLSTEASIAIDEAGDIGLSSISIWEAALLMQRGRIRFKLPTAAAIHAAVHVDPRVRELPVTSTTALAAVKLEGEGLTGDPADQLILATARQNSARLVTKDRNLLSFDPQSTVW